jgi:hypothetical protein
LPRQQTIDHRHILEADHSLLCAARIGSIADAAET